MKLALAGPAGSGKSSIFTALTSRKMSSSRGRDEGNLALLPVPDTRLDRLSEMYQPKKTTATQVACVDPAPVVGKGDDPSTKMPEELKQAEGLIIVVRNFDGGLGVPSPKADLENFSDEMILHDLILVENRLERMTLANKRGVKPDQEEQGILEQAKVMLSDGLPLTNLAGLADHAGLKGFGFLSAKPSVIVASNDDDDPDPPDLGTEISPVVVRARIEAELAELPEDERIEFAEDLGIKDSALDRLIAASYKALDLVTFFTVGDDEVRGWTIKKGGNALAAAGAIHSDLERGFIRAEVMRWDELLEHGSEPAIKKAGLMKLAGKDYIVQDGDIVHVRFNV